MKPVGHKHLFCSIHVPLFLQSRLHASKMVRQSSTELDILKNNGVNHFFIIINNRIRAIIKFYCSEDSRDKRHRVLSSVLFYYDIRLFFYTTISISQILRDIIRLLILESFTHWCSSIIYSYCIHKPSNEIWFCIEVSRVLNPQYTMPVHERLY